MRYVITIVAVAIVALALMAWLTYVFQDEDLAASVFWIIATVTSIALRRSTWPLGVFFSLSLLCAYLEHRIGNEHARDIFHVLYKIGLAVYLLSDFISKWMKKLWGKIRSAGLTAINQASFRRQAKDAFS